MYIGERYINYKLIHGHDRVKINSIEWYFHNYEHGYKHCTGGAKNPYTVDHFGKMHGIDKQYARGHGIKRKPQWFKFTKKIKSGLWDLSSGTPIDIKGVPKNFK